MTSLTGGHRRFRALQALRALQASGDELSAEYSLLRYRLGAKDVWAVAHQVLSAHLDAHTACDDDADGGALDYVRLLELAQEAFLASSSLKVALVLGCLGGFLYLLNSLIPHDLDHAAPGRPRSKTPPVRSAKNTRAVTGSKLKAT